MVLTDQARWLRIGVVAALWAALVGAFAAARYRNELLGHADRADQLQRIYEIELEREVSARREYERGVETTTRRQVEREVRNEVRGEVDGLRAELRTLRQNLEVPLGGEAPVQRLAPSAESPRLPPPGQGPSVFEPAVGPATIRDHRQPPAARQHRTQEPRSGRWRLPREDPPQPPARGHHAPEPASDPRPTTGHPPAAPTWQRLDSRVSANPAGNGSGGRRRRPDDVEPPPVTDITAGRRHDGDGKPASNGTGRRRASETRASETRAFETRGHATDSTVDTPEPRRRHRREA